MKYRTLCSGLFVKGYSKPVLCSTVGLVYFAGVWGGLFIGRFNPKPYNLNSEASFVRRGNPTQGAEGHVAATVPWQHVLDGCVGAVVPRLQCKGLGFTVDCGTPEAVPACIISTIKRQSQRGSVSNPQDHVRSAVRASSTGHAA